ncbi:cache domain-containing protein [Methylobacterium pseudosasicola]|uniref:Methyl-accepting chemotaxis protein n=1 Tax=Methylobacterium pseudosasicola TaxID=582667 RepID=A0A1I4FAJ9_9HYPH|nr:cache domain-containing protein [Methylobacterium pseudosasicola]SFL13836.1 methyl-accepting chemotaxis protein [Methylobacterium pseudosasicola]
MPKRVLFLCLPILALIVILPTRPVVGRDERVSVHQAVEIETLVNEAAETIESQGRAAFAAFRRKDSRWRYGDVYLFVVDMQGIVLFNAAHPNREGRDLLQEHDAAGKQFHKDFIGVVRESGSGWVDYMFPRPRRSTPEVKWSYVCGTSVDGTPALVGAGVYVE